MEENNSLDDFLASNTQEQQALQSNDMLQQEGARPKLKKIKRAKVRPVSDIPQAPEKVVAEDVSAPASETVEIITPIEENIIHEEQPQVVEDTTAKVDTFVDSDEKTELSNALISATEAQNLTNIDQDNSYILETLPPELDYIMDESAGEEYTDLSGYVKKNIVYLAASICLAIGLFLGKVFFAEQTIENKGLEGIVANPEVPAGRPRCGLTDKSQACIFYILNWYKQELNGRDFYKLAAQLTGREEYMIETDNLRYANVKIKPGHFAQLNIPAIK